MVHFVAEIPQHVRYRVSGLHHIAAARQIVGEAVHIGPPCLSAQERCAYALAAERGARGQKTYLRIVGVGVEHKVRHALGHVGVGNRFQVFEFLLPCHGERCECLGGHALLAVHACGGGCRFYRLEVDGADIVVAHRLPELAHGHVGIFEVFKYIAGNDVADGCLVCYGQTAVVGLRGHVAVEIFDGEAVDGQAPVAQEACGGLVVGYYVSEDCRQPFAELVARG